MTYDLPCDRVETATQRRRNVRRCLALTRAALASRARREPWETGAGAAREGAYPTREVLLEEVRALREERLRLEGVARAQEKIIAELRGALGCDSIGSEGLAVEKSRGRGEVFGRGKLGGITGENHRRRASE